MSSICNSLNNVNLDEAALTATSYNNLPHIDEMRGVAAKHGKAHARLLGLIASYGVSEYFSIHLVHKHFDIPENRVMVYEKICGRDHPHFVLCSPRDAGKCTNLRGLYFMASSGGKMSAYEYTNEPGVDLSAYSDFVAEFARTVLDLGVRDVFALTAKKLPGDLLTEFEMSDLLSTILVENCAWIPANSDPEQSTSTDWIATPDYAHNTDDSNVPGIITLKCMNTRSHGHYNVTCSRTRSGRHYQQTRGKLGEELILDGQVLAKDSEPYAIISRARAIVEV